MPQTFHIDLEPVGRRTEIPAGMSLLNAAQAAGVELEAICGGLGICEGCRVRLVSGELAPMTLEEEVSLSPEEIEQGFRLACQAIPMSDCRIDIPPESLTTPQRLQVEGLDIEIPIKLVTIPLDVQIDPPILDDLRSDTSRLRAAVVRCNQPVPEIGYPLLFELSEKLRDLKWNARLALHRNEVIAALPAQTRLYGLAVDVGTTKLAHYLVDLETGEIAARVGAMNPQISYGEDVISRILVANERPDGRHVLQSRLIDTMNQSIEELCARAGVRREQIVDAAVVGNTAMHHLFAGLPVKQLGFSPYVASVGEPLEFQAREIGLNLAPGAYIYMPPNIAGYVGADHISMLLASEIESQTGTVIALDIGTNTELSLVRDGRILSCSCASGPAFEGAHIHDGMRAAPGAVERVHIVDGELRVHTIGDQPAVGICGSGILDAVACMLQAGILDNRGNLRIDHPMVRTNGNKRHIVLVPAEKSGTGKDILVTRQDVNEIQLAKGAIRAGIEVLLSEAKTELDEIIVAGAFGTYLDIGSAVRVGMFPPLRKDHYHQVGNAAGTGARQMLVSSDRRKDAERLASKIEYIELTTHPKFTDKFVRAIMFNENME